MSETGTLLVDSASRMLTDFVTRDRLAAVEAGEWPEALWAGVREMGLDRAAQSEARGGSGIGVGALCALLRVAGRLAAPLPLAETWLAERTLAAGGLPPLADDRLPATVAPVLSGERPRLTRPGGMWRLSGTAHRVPWARFAKTAVIIADSADGPRPVVVDDAAITATGRNTAGEPRDTIRLDDAAVGDAAVGAASAGSTFDDLVLDGALFRGAQMVGAMERVLDLTVTYAKERVQFGRPIGRFQAVQQQIAVLAGEVVAASAAAHGAADARARHAARFEIACAKIRVGEAAGRVAAIAHQVHGAIGFTHEHSLHHCTRRLWAWRDEFGSEAEWSRWVGRAVATVGGEGLWPFITDPRGSAASKPLW